MTCFQFAYSCMLIYLFMSPIHIFLAVAYLNGYDPSTARSRVREALSWQHVWFLSEL